MRIGISGLGSGLGQVGGLEGLRASSRVSAVRLLLHPSRRRPMGELARFAFRRPPPPAPLAAEFDGLGLDLVHFATTRLPGLRRAPR